MGLILTVSPREKIHAEARRESFVVFDDYGKGFSLELEWELLPALKRAVDALHNHHQKQKGRAP